MKGPFGKDRVCGVVAAATSRQMIVQLRNGLHLTRTLELRLDYLRNARELSAFLLWLKRNRPRAVLIATCRRTIGGGFFRGSREGQLEILVRAVDAGCQWCDVEIETARHLSPMQFKTSLLPGRLIISHHDFRQTPANLGKIVRDLLRCGGEIAKLAAQCRSVADAVRICGIVSGRADTICIPMGEYGIAGRVLSLRGGSALTYAAIENATAPGQLSLEAMRVLYRAERITLRTRVFGVIGNPIGHSLSPLLHNTAFRTRRVDGVMLPFPVNKLGDFIGTIGAFGISGFAVTVPHKENILKYLDECDPLARRIGAVNTVAVRGGRLCGYNTDYLGVLRSLEKRMLLAGSKILLYGAGGAARAAAFALARSGVTVHVSARRTLRARELARAVGGRVVERKELRRASFDAIVNCTPVGMNSKGKSPLTSAEINCRIAMDMVYRPRETQFLKLARQRGVETISGLDMFLAQGAAQFEIWTGKKAPQAAMRRVVGAFLDDEETSRERSQPKK